MLFAVNSYDENSVVGCGYVSDHYLETLPNHQNLELLGVTDLKPERAQVLTKHYGLNIYDSLEAILADPASRSPSQFDLPGHPSQSNVPHFMRAQALKNRGADQLGRGLLLDDAVGFAHVPLIERRDLRRAEELRYYDPRCFSMGAHIRMRVPSPLESCNRS